MLKVQQEPQVEGLHVNGAMTQHSSTIRPSSWLLLVEVL
jgi:hypothetical protein